MSVASVLHGSLAPGVVAQRDILTQCKPNRTLCLEFPRASWILAQTFADFEVLSIDDDSTDRSRDVVKRFSHNVVIVAHRHD